MADPKERPETSKAASGPESDTATAVFDDLEKLKTRAQERDQFLDLLKRTQADFENYQKRNKREWDQERRYLHGDFAKGLLPVIDNLARAMAAAHKAGETGPLAQGVGMVQTQLLDLLKRQGVTAIDAVGKPFDPNLHQAVMQRPDSKVPPNTVLEVLEQGFMIHDRVLRPASVVVSQ